MASYDKPKLLALMEQRHTAHLSLIDLSKRWRDAKAEREIAENKIHAASRNHRLPDGFLCRLLALPTNDALSLSGDAVQYHETRTGEFVRRYQTGINLAVYRNFILTRDKAARLKEAHKNAENNFNERFGIVARLRDAVRERGFADPEWEM